MRLQKRFVTRLFIVGLGAALLFAVGTKAQEIVNTQFADSPFVEAMDQASTANLAHIEVQANSAARQDDNSEKQSAILLWTGTALIWVGAIGIYAGGPAQRFAREIQSLSKLYTPRGVGSDVKPLQGSTNDSQGPGYPDLPNDKARSEDSELISVEDVLCLR